MNTSLNSPNHARIKSVWRRMQCLALLAPALLSIPATAFEWSRLTPLAPRFQVVFNQVAHGGNNRVLASGGPYIGGGQTIILSEDAGQSWEMITNSEASPIKNILYGAGRFVLPQENGNVKTTVDGRAYSATHISDAGLLASILVNGSFYISTGDGKIAKSTDGLNWSLTESLSSSKLKFASYGGGKTMFAESGELTDTAVPFFAVVSTDGTNWARQNLNGIPVAITDFIFPSFTSQTATLLDLTFGDGKFIGLVRYGLKTPSFPIYQYYGSADGANWSKISASGSPGVLTYQEGLFHYLDGDTGPSGRSFDIGTDAFFPSAWQYLHFPFRPKEIAYGPSVVIVGESAAIGNGLVDLGLAVGSSLATAQFIGDPRNNFQGLSIAVHGNVLAAAGTNGVIVSTNLGKSFRRVLDTKEKIFTAVEYGNGQFVAVGAAGRLLASASGLTWNYLNSGTAANLRDVKFANGRWVVAGDGGVILTSTDGATFALSNSGTDIDLTGAAFGDGKWVVVGKSGAILTGAGTTWSLLGTDEGSSLSSVAFMNGKFVASGELGRTYSSANGITWTLKRIVGAADLFRVDSAHGQFAALEMGTTNTYISSDAANWTRVSISDSTLKLSSLDSTDGIFLASGTDANGVFNIEREVVIAGIMLSATIDADRRAQVQLQIPSPGEYKIFSATDAEAAAGNWNARGAVTASASGSIEWTDPEPLQSTRFYRARKE